MKFIWIYLLSCLLFFACDSGEVIFVLSPESDINDYVNSVDWRIRYQVAQSKNISTQQLDKLAGDEHYLVRSQVLKNPKINSEMISAFADESNVYVCLILAKHPLCDQGLLERLAENSNSDVREAVAKNSNSSVKVLDMLCNDDSWKVRLALVNNPNVSEEILFNWYQSSYHFVKKELVFLLATNHKACKKFLLFLQKNDELGMFNKIGQRIASYTNAHPSNLEFLASFDEWEICFEVAKNPNTPISMLTKLAYHDDESIRLEVAANSATPVDVLQKMISEDEDDDVREQALVNLQEQQGK